MKNIYTLLFLLLTLNLAYASFPVVEKQNTTNTEIVNSSQEFNLTESLTTAPAEFHFGGFLLGLLLGIIGVGLAYIFSDDEDFRRNSWYGLGTWLIIWLLLVGAAL